MLPRTKELVNKQVTVQKHQITVKFSLKEIEQALLDKYGNSDIGPEQYRIPSEYDFTVLNYLQDQEDCAQFVWYEDE